MTAHPPEKDYCSLFVGTETQVPLLNGSKTRYINFDNAASTPPIKAAQEAVVDFLPEPFGMVGIDAGTTNLLDKLAADKEGRISNHLGIEPKPRPSRQQLVDRIALSLLRRSGPGSRIVERGVGE